MVSILGSVWLKVLVQGLALVLMVFGKTLYLLQSVPLFTKKHTCKIVCN